MKSTVAIILMLFSMNVMADSFNLGIGGHYSLIQLPQNNGTQSLYQGPGYLLDARLRFLPYRQTSSFSFDLFAQGGQAFTRNTAASDNHQQDTFFGGIDINIRDLGFGFQYGRARSSIRTSSASALFNYDLIGARAGWQFLTTRKWNLVFNVVYLTGTAVAGGDNTISNNQKVNQWLGSLTFQYRLIGERRY